MLFFKQLTPEAASTLLSQLTAYTESVLLQKGPTLPYQLAYDQVYQLCRNEKQQQLMEILFSALRNTLPHVFGGVNSEGASFLEDFAQLIERTEKNVKQVSDICLYLDLNYCKRDGGEGLMAKLNTVLLSQLFGQSVLVESLGRHLAVSHISDSYEQIALALASLKRIDPEDDYFLAHFLKHYLPVITKHYSQETVTQFALFSQSNEIEKYIRYATERLEKEAHFLNKFWPESKRCEPNKQLVLRELYEILVTQHKQQIYTSHQVKLFNELTLQVLELFKYGSKSADIEKHADWYNLQIKQKLSTIPLENNTQFITQVCAFYNKIMGLLQSTYNKFDIHYRSRFAFEEWINGERLQMPVRLNEYIGHYCLGKLEGETDESRILQRIGVVFVLMKEKNVFEKGYRRELINRILKNFRFYSLEKECKIVDLMEKECSEEFVKHIKPIIESYNCRAADKGQASLLQTFLLNMDNWPYDEKNISVVINEQLLKLTKHERQSFSQSNKDKSLYWHPVVGVVRLEMSFCENEWRGELVVNTCMANLLLYFATRSYKPFELKSFCCETGYKLDDVYESVRKLLGVKVLLNEGTDENYKLAINESFSHTSPVFDIVNVQMGNKFQAKPLEQLKADRKFMVEAIVVKLMKRLKQADRETILKEASPLIEKRGFNFNSKFVESAIDRLIDKEFIRDYEDGRYGYIA